MVTPVIWAGDRTIVIDRDSTGEGVSSDTSDGTCSADAAGPALSDIVGHGVIAQHGGGGTAGDRVEPGDDGEATVSTGDTISAACAGPPRAALPATVVPVTWSCAAAGEHHAAGIGVEAGLAAATGRGRNRAVVVDLAGPGVVPVMVRLLVEVA